MLFHPQADYLYAQNGQILGFELRETAGIHDITALLDLYVKGPHSAIFNNPFPSGTLILSCQQSNDILILTVSDEFSQLSGIDLMLSCACLARTGMEITGATAVHIRADTLLLDGDDEIVITQDTFLFTDATSVTAPIE